MGKEVTVLKSLFYYSSTFLTSSKMRVGYLMRAGAYGVEYQQLRPKRYSDMHKPDRDGRFILGDKILVDSLDEFVVNRWEADDIVKRYGLKGGFYKSGLIKQENDEEDNIEVVKGVLKERYAGMHADFSNRFELEPLELANKLRHTVSVVSVYEDKDGKVLGFKLKSSSGLSYKRINGSDVYISAGSEFNITVREVVEMLASQDFNGCLTGGGSYLHLAVSGKGNAMVDYTVTGYSSQLKVIKVDDRDCEEIFGKESTDAGVVARAKVYLNSICR